MDQWLVRTASNRIEGPYTREHVLRLIREGKLGLQDEVCQGNQYWIYLHEQLEVQRQLGIQMPRARTPRSGDILEEEITETQTETDLENPLAPMPTEVPKDLSADYDGSTAVTLRSSPTPSPQPAPVDFKRPAPSAPPAVSVAGTSVLRTPLERPSVWRGLAWVLAIGAVVILFAMLQLFKNA